MVNVPGRFQRVVAAFEEGAKIRPCKTKANEHSAADLYDLVISFHERGFRDPRKSCEAQNVDLDGDEINEGDVHGDARESIKKLFDFGNDVVRLNICVEVENVLREVDWSSIASPEFKRRLMARLRDRGYDAGLCKSKWEKKGRTQLGEYEYIDINAKGTRYLVELSLAGEFTIARPTTYYTSLLQTFPDVFVGKPNEMKQIVKLMCNAIKKSMKSVDIHVPPWRRLTYSEAKWFGDYKRTTNDILSQTALKTNGNLVEYIPHGFQPVQFNCREDFGAKSEGHVRTGNLYLSLNQG